MGVLGFTRKRYISNKITHIRNGIHRNYRYSDYYIQNKYRYISSSNCTKYDSILPVLIVGAGPVGLVLSLLLTKLGVKCAVLERSTTFSKHPQAHFINNRSMEVFCKLDGLAEEIQQFQPPVELWRKFIYCTSLSGSIIGSVDHMQTQDFDQIVSPVSVAHFSQYKLNALLLKQLETIGFTVHSHEGLDHRPLGEKEILMGHNCISVEQNDNFINVTTSFVKEGKHIKKQIPCSFLIGADGAGSTVRNLVGIELRGEKDIQKLVSVHFLSQELGQYLMHEKPGMLFFIFNPGAIGVLVAHDLNQGEFVLQMPFYPPQHKFEDFTSETCKRLIFKLVGRELADINVLDVKPWVMHAEVAEKFLACDNRVILAGDAAHRFPPAGGFGMNTGIQDAHNLAWKLATVVKGIASVSFLSTYEMERRPIALFNTDLSIQNFQAAMAVPAALGLDPTIANSVHQAINNTVGTFLPSTLQKGLLDGIFSLGRVQLSDFVLNENNPLGSSRLAKVRRIFEEGKSLQLQFPAEDLGFRYREGALIPETDSEGEPIKPEPPTGRRREYIPSADPGSRLPHMNIRVLSELTKEVTISTLDLISEDKLEFLLIIAPIDSSYRLAHAALTVADEYNILVKVCVMWPNGLVNGDARTKTSLVPWENYVDVVEVRQPSNSSSWWDLCKMTYRGAILVRPDDHIAWRVKSTVVGDSRVEMKRVFSAILGS
uniref:2,4-dichlorophenol 6-monooxygenase n=1 Tax=Erigeron canadensis TaxID=72917 RepID=UPI001CB9A57D|nr:2,4-dichlorophenol 6-monooxygenase [Erigeron canadensis]